MGGRGYTPLHTNGKEKEKTELQETLINNNGYRGAGLGNIMHKFGNESHLEVTFFPRSIWRPYGTSLEFVNYGGQRLYQYNEDDFFIYFQIVNKLSSNCKFTGN